MIVNSRASEILEVRGAEYPPAPHKRKMAQAVGYLQMSLLGMVFGGEKICTALGVPVPGFIDALGKNTVMSFMGIWLVGNVVQGNLLNTGAFEIHHGDKLIWSSLEMGRLPTMHDLIQAFGKTGITLDMRPQGGQP